MLFRSKTMVRFREREIAKKKENVLCCKKAIKIRDVNVDNIVISKFVKTKTISKYLIAYLDKDNKSVLLISKMSRCVKAFKVEEGDKEKKIN